jgi:hypothetical protein
MYGSQCRLFIFIPLEVQTASAKDTCFPIVSFVIMPVRYFLYVINL